MEMCIRERDEEIRSLKGQISDLESMDKNREEIIKEKEQQVQNLKYKIKDTQETFEVNNA